MFLSKTSQKASIRNLEKLVRSCAVASQQTQLCQASRANLMTNNRYMTKRAPMQNSMLVQKGMTIRSFAMPEHIVLEMPNLSPTMEKVMRLPFALLS